MEGSAVLDLHTAHSPGPSSGWSGPGDVLAAEALDGSDQHEAELEHLADQEQSGYWRPAVRAGRLVVDRHPALRTHAGTPPDLLLTWGPMRAPVLVDVVVHLHGYSGKGRRMSIVRDKAPMSGLDLEDPEGGGRGRTAPTLLVLPRGHWFGGRSGMGYSFPALTGAGALRALVDDALSRFGVETGAAAGLGRLIVTAHSGGGAAAMALLRHTDPDEVHCFDALYGDPAPLITWARKRMGQGTGALRVLFRAGEGTARSSLAVAAALGDRSPSFRVEQTRVSHNDMPRRYGWRLLADASADLPGATRPAVRRAAREVDESLTEQEAVQLDLAGALPEPEQEWLEAEGAPSHAEQRSDLEDEAEGGQPVSGEDPWDPEAYEHETGHAAAEGTDNGLHGWAEQEEPEEPEDAEHTGPLARLAEEGTSPSGLAPFVEEDLSSDEAAYERAFHEAYERVEGEDELRGEDADVEVELWALSEQETVEHEGFPSGLVLTPVSGATGRDEEHWDPSGTGLPLYATGPDVRSKKLSTHFTVGELVTSGGRAADRARISLELVTLLQSVRDRVGRPVRITSGYRSWSRNVAVYRARGKQPTASRHCSGQAADVTVAGMSGMDIAKAALDAYGDRIGVGIAGTFAHLDVRGSWTVWTYLSGDADRRAKAELHAYRASRTARPGPVPAPSPAPAPAPAGSDRAAGRVVLGAFQRCTSGELPGARAMADQWRRLTGRTAQTWNCRAKDSGTPSLHGEGRSVDLFARADRAAERAQAEAYVAWMIANAVELQVAVIIWNRRIWSWGRRAQGWRAYTGRNPHVDHIHVDLSREGARLPSRLLSGDVPDLSSGPPAPVPPQPARPGPPPGGAPAHVVDFVRRFGPHARAGQASTSVPALVTLGQAALESGWGKRAPGFNFFGIKARASDPEETRQLLTTREVLARPDAVFPEVVSVTRRPDGRYDYVVKDWFRRYASPEDSFAAHGQFLRRNKRYAGAFAHTADPYAFARAVAAAGYATYPRYADSLTSVMRLLERAEGSAGTAREGALEHA